MNSGTEILKILKGQNIKSIDDINQYPTSEFAMSDDSICGKDETWVDEIFSIIKNDMKYSNKQLLTNEKKYITFSDDSDDILKYACMFPEMSINLKETFNEYETCKGTIFYTIPKDFFRSMIKRKNLIQEGVYKLLPELIKATDEVATDMDGLYSTWSLSGKREYYQNQLEHEVNVLTSNGIFLSNDNIEKLYCTFPWLYGVRIEDYISIVNKNRRLYDNYCTTILKFTEAIHNGDYSSFKYEMDEANYSIRIELEKAQSNLRRKGIQTVMSIAFSFIPMALSIPEEQKLLLSTLIGATSLKDIFITFSDEIATLREAGKSSPFWLMYQWQKKVKI